MKFSIIIPVKNEELVIGKLIKHIRENASVLDFGEIIVVDGNSTDYTTTIATSSGAIVVKSLKAGRATQMNLGSSFAKYPYLFFLHADTFPPKNWDIILNNSIKTNTSEAACFRLAFDSNHPVLNFYSWFTRFDRRFVRYGDQGLIVKKSLFNSIHGFSEKLIVMEDNEIVYRLKEKTSFTIIPYNAITSARKYEKNGIVRLQFIFTLIYLGYMIGISQEVLVHLYKSFIKA